MPTKKFTSTESGTNFKEFSGMIIQLQFSDAEWEQFKEAVSIMLPPTLKASIIDQLGMK